MKFIEFLVLHIVFTLLIIKVVIRGEEMAAELTTTTQTAFSHLFLMLFAFNVGLKLFGTGKLRVAVIAT